MNVFYTHTISNHTFHLFRRSHRQIMVNISSTPSAIKTMLEKTCSWWVRVSTNLINSSEITFCANSSSLNRILKYSHRGENQIVTVVQQRFFFSLTCFYLVLGHWAGIQTGMRVWCDVINRENSGRSPAAGEWHQRMHAWVALKVDRLQHALQRLGGSREGSTNFCDATQCKRCSGSEYSSLHESACHYILFKSSAYD